MSKQETTFFFLKLDIQDNPIYVFWYADGQELDLFLKCQKLHFSKLSNFAIMIIATLDNYK